MLNMTAARGTATPTSGGRDPGIGRVRSQGETEKTEEARGGAGGTDAHRSYKRTGAEGRGAG